jgi:ATP-dependent Lhr-like helicase
VLFDFSAETALQIPESLVWAHPLVQEWFVGRFTTPTEPQEQGWPHILAGHATLISAPTGSGKTLAAFLACIDRLVRRAITGELLDRIEVLYVSPLKALGNDIQKNLERPLGEIMQLAAQRGLLMPEIRTFVRTGDTLPAERQKMLRRPPHILVTTPESLYILLTAEKSRQLLRHVETVIVDEIHAVADDKRGAHLALSLERLEALACQKPVRIGLSATQKPIELVAEFLTGSDPKRTPAAIVNVGHRRKMDLAVEVPQSELGAVATTVIWDEIYDRLCELIQQHRSTLIFVNTRTLTERLAHNLADRLGEENVAAHHGSLSRKLRLSAESRLRNGEIRVLVATASLELGIDVGHIDLVCHISSPRQIAIMLQRIGRAGHWRGAVPKGRIFPTTRDELVECAALVRAIQSGDLDRLLIPEAPLDVLAQQIVAMCAAEEWRESNILQLARYAYPYRNLSEEEFERIIAMLADGIAAQRGRYGAYLHRDRVNGLVRARRGSRMIAVTNGGAIPDTSVFLVIAEPDGTPVGTLDEDFAVESNVGDIMLLGNTSWRIRRVESKGRVLVEDAHGAAPTIPFWRGEAPQRTPELSEHVAQIRQTVHELIPGHIRADLSRSADLILHPGVVDGIEWLKKECGLDDAGAQQIVQFIVEGRTILGTVPTRKTIIAERFFDEGGGMQLIIHAPFGGKINKAWGLALRKRFCRSFNFELQAAATDNGLNISLAEQHSFPLADVFRFLHVNTVQEILEQAALPSPIFGSRFRWDAGRALALLRYRNGKKVPPQVLRTKSDDLLASVFPDVAACQENIEGDIKIPDHPLVREVMKDVLTEAMDIDGLKEVLSQIESGAIQCIAVDTPVPSVFSHEILNSHPYAYLDDAPLEERRARAVEMRRVLPAAVLDEVGHLDPAAIAEVRQDAWPDIRDADELHDALLTLIAIPENLQEFHKPNPADQWGSWFEKLQLTGRATRARVNEDAFWVAAEKLLTFRAIYPDAVIEDQLASIESARPSQPDAILTMITGWMMHLGPTTATALSGMLSLPEHEIEKALLRLEGSGTILRGKYELADPNVTEWCERRLLARVHRLTLGALRKQIEPVTAAAFMRWLFEWQHVSTGAQTAGEHGVLEVIRQLQGFELPAVAWERDILARRVVNYDSSHLDRLCLMGTIGWGRISPHPATLESSQTGLRRIVPTSVAPVTFFVREDADWIAASHHEENASPELERSLSPIAQEVLAFLKARGALFFADIVRGTGKLKSEIETGLWELVAAGLLTADGFDNLRSLIDPGRRRENGRSLRSLRPRNNAGRWSLLFNRDSVERTAAIEAACRMLLRRYGVVFRELLVRESVLPKWRELLQVFRRLEARGEIRGGRFVAGFLGEQFALPEAVESLRAHKKVPSSDQTITISAADPLNLIGILVPGERVPAISSRTVSYRDGIAVESTLEAEPSDVVTQVNVQSAG